MIPVTYLPRPKLSFKRINSVIGITLEPSPAISLSASKTIVVIQQDGGGSAVTLSLTTGAAPVNGGRVVMIQDEKIVYWQPNSGLMPVGISITSASANSEITVTTSGKVTIPGWGLTPNTTYYATTNGVLSTNPTVGWYQLLGTSISSETIVLNIQQPINTI